MIFDLDRFKAVNDRYGHHVGDTLLRAVARAASQSLRPTDLFGRYGGEEFAVCLPDTGPEAALAAGERLRAAVAATTIVWNEQMIGVTASVGVSTSDIHRDAELDTLLNHADRAQYLAKRSGANRVRAHDPAAGSGSRPEGTR